MTVLQLDRETAKRSATNANQWLDARSLRLGRDKMEGITPVIVPKWGLAMSEGTIVTWHKSVGDEIGFDEDLVDIETAKITNVGPAPAAGVLRRILAQEGETKTVGALIGVIAADDVSDGDIDGFVASFAPDVSAGDIDASGVSIFDTEMVEAGLGPVAFGSRGDAAGRPVIFIHGFGSDMASWSMNVAAFPADRRILAVDLPGHGASTKNVGDGTVATLAKALLDGLDQLGVGQVDIVGHSLGAAVALALAAQLGARAGRMVLICPVGLPGITTSAEFLDGFIGARRKRELRGFLEMLVDDPERIGNEFVESTIRFRRLDGVSEALTAIRDRVVAGEGFEGLMGVASERDAYVILGSSDRIAAGTPEGLRSLTVEGSGHLPHIEKSSEFNAAMISELS